MIELAKNKFIDLLNKDYAYIIDSKKEIRIVEKSDDGKGTCTFFSQNDVLLMIAKNSGSHVWALNKKNCAEAAFLEIDKDNNKRLHILEMKKTFKVSTMEHACKQLEGMYFSALSVMNVLKLGLPDVVISYIAYSKLDPIFEAKDTELPPIYHKMEIGNDAKIIPEIDMWQKKIIPFAHIKSNLVSNQRDELGDCIFGQI